MANTLKSDSRKMTKEARTALRTRAIELLQSGETQVFISEVLGVRRATVNSWVKSYRELGTAGTQEKKRGVTSESRKLLTSKQEESIQKMIIDKMPDQLQLPFGLWTRKAVKELVFREFGVTLAINTMGDYLRKWGYSPQKPKKRAYEQNPEIVKRWLQKEYPAIAARAKQEGAVIQWGDETGVRNTNQHGRSYAPKGKTPVKLHMAKRFSINMISTVTNQGKVEFMIYSGSMNAERLIEFMKQLIKNKSQKTFLILDNLRVHHSKKVKQWVEENNEKIELFHLPAYSPEKNPDEYLNCDLKYGLSDIKAPKKVEELKNNVENHMKMLQNNPDRIKKYFKHEEIKYAA
jgi:transposase